jgi:hypothetical protein
MTDEEDGSLIEQYTTPEERVEMVARQIREPRPVRWIAEESDSPVEATRSVLESLVEDDVLTRLDADPTMYAPGPEHLSS